MASDWGTKKGACEHCGGDVRWWYFGADSSGSGAGRGERCVSCGRGTKDGKPLCPHEELAMGNVCCACGEVQP